MRTSSPCGVAGPARNVREVARARERHHQYGLARCVRRRWGRSFHGMATTTTTTSTRNSDTPRYGKTADVVSRRGVTPGLDRHVRLGVWPKGYSWCSPDAWRAPVAQVTPRRTPYTGCSETSTIAGVAP